MANDTMQNLRHRLSAELDAMNAYMREGLHTDDPLLSRVVAQYLLTKGKQIRPLLVMLSAKLFGGITESTLHSAASLEMLHNASLIHDDVVDKSDYRRGTPTINRDFDNRIAVLTGDFFVSNALAEVIKTGDIKAITSVAELGKELSLGEIDQISNARECTFDENRYMDVISKKTASLFMKCIKMGAESAGADSFMVANAVEYGRLLGLCFQIKDDIFDYYEDKEIGKPTGNDLRENKVSLPLLYALRVGPAEESEHMKSLIRRGCLTDSEIAKLIEFAKKNGGIDYAYSVMERMRGESEAILKTLPSNEWSSAFSSLFAFTIARHF
ncbi:MAG: polyprenyl synthetase family protein [Muribaculum sp.]|nr:polyprenyl synthetase family protein [Muribaculum sp.]